MSDSSTRPSRPVSWSALIAVTLGLSVFFILTRWMYISHVPAAPQNVAPEKLPADLAWKATHETRRAYLLELKDKQSTQATSYAWIDKSKGAVQLPIERAIELYVNETNASNSSK